MSKSILVIDTPKSCLDCIVNCHTFEEFKANHVTNEEWEFVEHNVLKDCPLRDTSPLLEALEESITNAKIEYDESGYIATTLHTNTVEEQKKILFSNIEQSINKLKQELGVNNENK